MIQIQTNIQQAVQNLRRLPGAFHRAGTKTLEQAAITTHRIMQRPGLPVTYPINWDSDKQKIYVIAKLRREGNLPYERTGDTEQAWGYASITNGYEVSNIGHNAVFLYGTPSGVLPGAVKVTPSGQSHIHAGRWRLIHEVLTAVLSRLPDSLLQALKIEASQ